MQHNEQEGRLGFNYIMIQLEPSMEPFFSMHGTVHIGLVIFSLHQTVHKWAWLSAKMCGLFFKGVGVAKVSLYFCCDDQF